jgi:hypothetical protein
MSHENAISDVGDIEKKTIIKLKRSTYIINQISGRLIGKEKQ